MVARGLDSKRLSSSLQHVYCLSNNQNKQLSFKVTTEVTANRTADSVICEIEIAKHVGKHRVMQSIICGKEPMKNLSISHLHKIQKLLSVKIIVNNSLWKCTANMCESSITNSLEQSSLESLTVVADETTVQLAKQSMKII